jgi:hypothetical protein
VTEESVPETETMVARIDGATEKRVRFADENDIWEFDVDNKKADSEAVSSTFFGNEVDGSAETDEIHLVSSSRSESKLSVDGAEVDVVLGGEAAGTGAQEQSTSVATRAKKEDTYNCLRGQRSLSNELRRQVNASLETATSAVDAAFTATTDSDSRSALPKFTPIGRSPRQWSWTSLRSNEKGFDLPTSLQRGRRLD